jgi:WD40 repeat protein
MIHGLDSSIVGRRLALVIGVNNALKSGLSSLKYAIADAEAIAQALKQYGKFEILGSPLLGEDATSDNIKKGILDLAWNRSNKDFLLLYFSGHAKKIVVEAQRQETYLITADFDQRYVNQDEKLFVSMHWLREKLFIGTEAGQVLIILDCCFAGEIGNTAPDHYLEELRHRIAYYFETSGAEIEMKRGGMRGAIAATSYDQPAQELNGHSLMTEQLLHALRGEVEDIVGDNGQITLHRLAEYIQEEMPPEQKPTISVSNAAGQSCILAWKHKPSIQAYNEQHQNSIINLPKSYIPYPSSPLFQPRPDEFEKLEALLLQSGKRPICIGLIGMGGIGKTQLAIELIYRIKHLFPAGIFWMPATGTNLFDWRRQMSELAFNSGYLPFDDDVTHPENEARRAHYLSSYLASHNDALLILDNVEVPDMIPSALPALAGGQMACAILYTSRITSIPDGMIAYSVEQLSEESALRLLLEVTRPNIWNSIITNNKSSEVQAARLICRGVEYLPLALIHLRAFLTQDPYLTLVRFKSVLDKRGVLGVTKIQRNNLASLYATFLLSWEKINNYKARNLFKLASFFPEAAPIPLWLLGLATNLGESGDIFEPLGEARLHLQEVSLMETLTEEQVRLHPLVREFGQKLAREENNSEKPILENAIKRLINNLTDINKLENRAIDLGYNKCLEHIQIALEYIQNLDVEQLDLQIDLLKSIVRWMDRESYLLSEGSFWPQVLPGLFYQQLFNHSIEENSSPLTEKTASTIWFRQEEPIGTEDKALLRIFANHTGWVLSVAFSPNGSQVLTGSDDHTARLWDTANAKLLSTLEGHTGAVTSVVFSPNGSQVLTGSDDHTARLWNLVTKQIEIILKDNDYSITSAIFSPKDTQILIGLEDGTARLWDTANATLKATLEGHAGAVTSVAFSPDGTQILTGSDDKTARLWNTANATLKATLEGHAGWVTSVAFSPDGTQILTGSDDGIARLWNTANATLKATLEGHADWVTSVAFSPDGTLALTGSYDRKVRLWDIVNATRHSKLEDATDRIVSTAFSPDGTRILTGSEQGGVYLWNTPSLLQPQATFIGHTSKVGSVAFSPDGTFALTGSNDRTLRLWDIANNQLRTTFIGHTGSVRSVAFSPDGTFALTGSNDRTLRLWDIANNQLRTTFIGYTSRVRSVAFSPDGTLVIAGLQDGTALLWSITDEMPKATLKGHTGSILSVAFSPDSTLALTGSQDGTALLWSITGEMPKATLKGHTGSILSVAFSPTGNLVMTCDTQGRALLWSATKAHGVGHLLGMYVTTYPAQGIHWRNENHIVLTDSGGAYSRPNLYRLSIEGLNQKNP